jgi:hypothetical protein
MEELQFRYELVPAVLVCCICEQEIARGEMFDKVFTTQNHVTTERWAHKTCVNGLAGKP